MKVRAAATHAHARLGATFGAMFGAMSCARVALCVAAWAVPPAALAAASAPKNAIVMPISATAAGRTTAAAPIVSGDLIVKFRDASEPGGQLAAVLAGQRTVASVAPLAARLSAELGLPLVLVQVTSGREALLALDRAALTRALIAQAEREPAVQRASVAAAAASAPVLPSAELVLRLELRGQGLRADLPLRLAAAGLAPPRLQTEPGGTTWRATYDIDALTLALIGRLRERPDVEYVQPNRLLRPAPAASR